MKKILLGLLIVGALSACTSSKEKEMDMSAQAAPTNVSAPVVGPITTPVQVTAPAAPPAPVQTTPATAPAAPTTSAPAANAAPAAAPATTPSNG